MMENHKPMPMKRAPAPAGKKPKKRKAPKRMPRDTGGY